MIFLGKVGGTAAGFRFGCWIAEMSAGKPLLAGAQPIRVDAVKAHSTTIITMRAIRNGRRKRNGGIG